MPKVSDIRKYTLKLYAADSHDVVKVADIVDSLSKAWNWITDPEFRFDLRRLNVKTVKTEKIIKELDKATKQLLKYIDSGNLAGYDFALSEVKRLSGELSEAAAEAEDIKKELGESVIDNIDDAPSSVPFTYTAKKPPVKVPVKVKDEQNTAEKAQETLESIPGFEFSGNFLKINQSYDIPLDQISYFKDSYNSPTKVKFTQANKAALIRQIQKSIPAPYKIEHLDNDSVNAIRDAIIKGNLIKIEALQPVTFMKKDEKPVPGSLLVTILSQPIELDYDDYKLRFKLKVKLRDKTEALGLSKSGQVSVARSDIEDFQFLEKTKEPSFEEPIEEESIIDEDKGATVNASDRFRDLLKYAAGKEVPYDKNKTVSQEEFAEILAKGYEMAFGQKPSLQALAGGYSQGELENGSRGNRVVLPNNAIGRIKATPGWISSGGDYYRSKAYEKTPEGKPFEVPGDRWRAYATPEEGAMHYWKLLGRDRYKSSLAYFEAGDPSSAAVSLGLGGYYTANIKNYAKGLTGRYAYFFNNIAPKIEHLNLKLETQKHVPHLSVKNWSSEYSAEEKKKARQSPQQVLDKEDEAPVNSIELDSAISKLLSASSNFDFDYKKLNLDSYLIALSSENASLADKIEYARVTANILRKFAGIKVSIFKSEGFDQSDVELRVYSDKEQFELVRGIAVICNMVSNSMESTLSHHPLVRANVFKDPEISVPLKKMSAESLMKNHRKFTLALNLGKCKE